MIWDEPSIRRRIAELDVHPGWYQNIDLGNGITTKTRQVWGEEIDHPRARWEEIAPAVPDSLAGLSVLDIGCNAGYVAFEAKRRGAAHVVGVDYNAAYIEQARFCAEVRGDDVDFRVLNVYDLDQLGRQFDFVFCVGVLYHCARLMDAVEQIAGVAGGTLVVESAIHPGNNELPLVRYTGNPFDETARRLPGHWHPNLTAMQDLFAGQGFVDVQELFRAGGRGGIVGTRAPPVQPDLSGTNESGAGGTMSSNG